MKDLKQLIAEQKEDYLDKYNTGDNWLYRLNKKEDCYYSCGSEVLGWHTTSLKSLLLALRENSDEMQSCYPEDIFSEPWEGWEKDISDLAKSKGMALDNVSAWYGRWQEKVMKERVSTLITEAINSLEE